jgi:hypothetical protein
VFVLILRFGARMNQKDPTGRWELASLLERLLAELPSSSQRGYVELVIQLLKKPVGPPRKIIHFQWNVVAAEVAHALIDARHPIDMQPLGESSWHVEVQIGSPAEVAVNIGIDAGRAIFDQRTKRSDAERRAIAMPQSLDDFLDQVAKARLSDPHPPAKECVELLKSAEAHLYRMRKRLNDAEDLVDDWRAQVEASDERIRTLQEALGSQGGGSAGTR